ncbi:hypothetical protein PIB30_067402 [Stylosanthes scabra]|uniref:Uncharacterized protein n=1 Tax=Stylosanthes scabra TaxID=79078 RepID=A0ABU6TMB6_9FABA|nr:hypothetical protein [Stylosanthes scabra]
MVDASAGGALMNKTPEEAWELIESIADNNQHFKVRATSAAKGVFEVTPSKSTILAKSLVDIAAMLKEIKEGQAAASKPLTQHANTSQQVPVKHCGFEEKGFRASFGKPEPLFKRFLKVNCSRAPENRFYLQQSRFSEPFPKKKGISRRIDSDALRVDSILEMVWKRARESIRESIPRVKNLVLEKEMNEKERNPASERERSYISCIVPYPLDRRKSVTRDDITLQVHNLDDKRSDDAFHGRRSSPLRCYES